MIGKTIAHYRILDKLANVRASVPVVKPAFEWENAGRWCFTAPLEIAMRGGLPTKPECGLKSIR
jgi:hypothetical protein